MPADKNSSSPSGAAVPDVSTNYTREPSEPQRQDPLRSQRDDGPMADRLEKVLDRVIDWLKYEEAKNGALVTLDGVGLALVWPNVASAPTPFVIAVVSGFMLSLVVALASYFPIVKGRRIHRYMKHRRRKRQEHDSSWQPNVLYFFDIAGYQADKYLADFRSASGVAEQGDLSRNEVSANPQSLELAYADHIVANSELAVIKLRLFEIGFYLSVLALVIAALSVLFKGRG